jgi:hypothetical protein
MEENNEIQLLKNRIDLLEKKYKELVDEYMEFTCMCNKPVYFHTFKDETEFKNELLKRIDD